MSRARAGSARDARIFINDVVGEISARVIRPRNARWIYVVGHGAGAGMDHPFLDGVAARLSRRGIATLRYQFPYMEAGRRRPDPPAVLKATVRAALAAARRARVPIVAGGKSMGGRMTSALLADEPDARVSGLVFLGFPLHAANKPGATRGDHLRDVDRPMLFVQGTRDPLAELARVRRLCRSLGARATLHVVDGGDHSFQVLKRSGRSPDEVLDEIADVVAGWGERIITA